MLFKVHSNAIRLTLILLSLSYFIQEEKVFARSFEGVPSKMVNGKRTMPNDFSPNSPQKVSIKSRLRLPLKFVPFKKVVIPNQFREKRVTYVPSHQVVQTLRARLDRSNHFYFKGYHVVTNPIKWDRTKDYYEMELVINQTFGANQQIEEQIGTIKLSGDLVGGPDLYRYDAVSQKKFVNKVGATVLEVNVGWPQQNRFSRLPQKKKWNKQQQQMKKPLLMPSHKPAHKSKDKVLKVPEKKINTDGWSQG